MATNPYQNFYRKFTKKILDKIVSPQVLGDTEALENKINIENEQFHNIGKGPRSEGVKDSRGRVEKDRRLEGWRVGRLDG